MQIVVLAGGRGQRLHPLTARRPKPMLPVMGRPLLGQLLAHLAAQRGVEEIIVTTGYLGEVIAGYLPGLRLPVPVRSVREDRPRGTAGAVADLLPRLRPPFAVVSADTVADLDLAAMRGAHRRQRAVATVCVAPPGERLRYGLVEASQGRVRALVEKPPLGRLSPAAMVSAGAYVLEGEAFAGWDPRAPLDFGRDILPGLVAGGRAVAAVAAARFWMDLGTAESYRDAHLAALSGRWPWPLPASSRPQLVDGHADVSGPVHFGSNVVVGPNARLAGPLYVGDDVVIGPDADVAGSVLLDGCWIGAGSWVHDAVVDAGTVLASASAVAGGIVGSPGAAPVAEVAPADVRGPMPVEVAADDE